MLWVALELALNLAGKGSYSLEKGFQLAGAACNCLGGKSVTIVLR